MWWCDRVGASGGTPAQVCVCLDVFLWPARACGSSLERLCRRAGRLGLAGPEGTRQPGAISATGAPQGPAELARPPRARASDGHAAAGGSLAPITLIRTAAEPLHRCPATPRRAACASAAVSRQDNSGQDPAGVHLHLDDPKGHYRLISLRKRLPDSRDGCSPWRGVILRAGNLQTDGVNLQMRLSSVELQVRPLQLGSCLGARSA